MGKYDFDMGIIGGGAAGLTVASGASQLGAKTVLIEKEANLGGDCLHYGCVPSKTLIRTAQVYHLMRNSSKFGLPAVELPPADFSNVAKRIQSVIAVIQKHDSVERFCGMGVKVKFGQAKFTDEHTVMLDEEKLIAKNWVIATGSSPRIPDIPWLSKIPYITNREIFSLQVLPKTMLVVGAGPIGIEMAQAFVRLGTRVSVVEMGEQILPKEDKDMADTVMENMKSEGVDFYFNNSVVDAVDRGGQYELILKNPVNGVHSLKAEKVLVATGRSSNTQGLGLDGIGIRTERGAIIVDKRLRATRKNVFGAGDVTGGFQFTHAAGYEGGIVLANAVFHLPKKVDYGFMPWCTYTDPELSSIGLNEKSAKARNIKYSVYEEKFEGNDRSLAEGEKSGKIKMILNSKSRPIGVQIVGPHAGELISEWVAFLNVGGKLSKLASSIHPYPTLGEINKRVAGNYFSKKIFSDRTRKILKLFFNLKGRSSC